MNHFSDILLLLGVAGLTIPFLHRLRISPVLGYLLCGMAVGPYALGLLTAQDMQTVTSFAALGVILLMFMIGLQLSLSDLWRMRHHVLGLGSCQILLTGVLIFAIARLFGNTPQMAILLGACFSLSSTAMVMQLLEDKGKTHAPVGKVCFSVLLMQDIAVVPILTLLSAFATQGEAGLALQTGKALLTAAAVICAIYFAGRKILGPLLRAARMGGRPEWLISFALFLVLGTATVTEFFGLSAALGAFLAGLLLAGTDCKKDVQDIISPVKSVLLGIFFLSVGMMIDLRAVLDDPFWLFASVAGIGAIKAGVLFAACLAFGLKKDVAAESAVMLGQGGEFVFVIVTLALSCGLVTAADAQFFMLVTALSLAVTPFVVSLAPVMARRLKGG